MPNHIKALVSILAAAVAVAVFFFEQQAGSHTVKWLALGLGAFMIVAMWVFPEPKGRGNKRKP